MASAMTLDRAASRRLEAWLRHNVGARATIGHPLNVHIDQIAKRLDRSRWVECGFELLAAAIRSPSLRGTGCIVCLVFHLDPDVDLASIDTASPETQWTGYLYLTPPELELVQCQDYEMYERVFQETGRVIGAIDVGTETATVYLAERVDRYGDQADRVRHIWVVLKGER